VLGSVASWNRRRVRVVVGASLIYLATLLPFFVIGRLRVQVVPVMAVLAAAGVLWLVQRLRAGDAKALAIGGVVLAACAPAVLIRPDWMAQRHDSVVAIDWYNLGSVLARSGDPDGAVRAYEHAVDTNAASVPAALRALGTHYQERGDLPRAEATMRRVLELRPDSRRGRTALLGLYEIMLRDPRYQNDPGIRARRDALAAGDVATVLSSSAAVPSRIDRPSVDTETALAPAAREAMLARLTDEGPHAAWIVHEPRDAHAVALAGQLKAIFEAAGWTVRSNDAAGFPLRPGIVLLAADNTPSPATTAVAEGLARAGLSASVASGYRAYSEERRQSQPDWRGLRLAADQDFVLVVGRR
jgi:tetratricopeptide (TPR) repeat protein